MKTKQEQIQQTSQVQGQSTKDTSAKIQSPAKLDNGDQVSQIPGRTIVIEDPYDSNDFVGSSQEASGMSGAKMNKKKKKEESLICKKNFRKRSQKQKDKDKVKKKKTKSSLSPNKKKKETPIVVDITSITSSQAQDNKDIENLLEDSKDNVEEISANLSRYFDKEYKSKRKPLKLKNCAKNMKNAQLYDGYNKSQRRSSQKTDQRTSSQKKNGGTPYNELYLPDKMQIKIVSGKGFLRLADCKQVFPYHLGCVGDKQYWEQSKRNYNQMTSATRYDVHGKVIELPSLNYTGGERPDLDAINFPYAGRSIGDLRFEDDLKYDGLKPDKTRARNPGGYKVNCRLFKNHKYKTKTGLEHTFTCPLGSGCIDIHYDQASWATIIPDEGIPMLLVMCGWQLRPLPEIAQYMNMNTRISEIERERYSVILGSTQVLYWDGTYELIDPDEIERQASAYGRNPRGQQKINLEELKPEETPDLKLKAGKEEKFYNVLDPIFWKNFQFTYLPQSLMGMIKQKSIMCGYCFLELTSLYKCRDHLNKNCPNRKLQGIFCEPLFYEVVCVYLGIILIRNGQNSSGPIGRIRQYRYNKNTLGGAQADHQEKQWIEQYSKKFQNMNKTKLKAIMVAKIGKHSRPFLEFTDCTKMRQQYGCYDIQDFLNLLRQASVLGVSGKKSFKFPLTEASFPDAAQSIFEEQNESKPEEWVTQNEILALMVDSRNEVLPPVSAPTSPGRSLRKPNSQALKNMTQKEKQEQIDEYKRLEYEKRISDAQQPAYYMQQGHSIFDHRRGKPEFNMLGNVFPSHNRLVSWDQDQDDINKEFENKDLEVTHFVKFRIFQMLDDSIKHLLKLENHDNMINICFVNWPAAAVFQLKLDTFNKVVIVIKCTGQMKQCMRHAQPDNVSIVESPELTFLTSWKFKYKLDIVLFFESLSCLDCPQIYDLVHSYYPKLGPSGQLGTVDFGYHDKHSKANASHLQKVKRDNYNRETQYRWTRTPSFIGQILKVAMKNIPSYQSNSLADCQRREFDIYPQVDECKYHVSQSFKLVMIFGSFRAAPQKKRLTSEVEKNDEASKNNQHLKMKNRPNIDPKKQKRCNDMLQKLEDPPKKEQVEKPKHLQVLKLGNIKDKNACQAPKASPLSDEDNNSLWNNCNIYKNPRNNSDLPPTKPPGPRKQDQWIQKQNTFGTHESQSQIFEQQTDQASPPTFPLQMKGEQAKQKKKKKQQEQFELQDQRSENSDSNSSSSSQGTEKMIDSKMDFEDLCGFAKNNESPVKLKDNILNQDDTSQNTKMEGVELEQKQETEQNLEDQEDDRTFTDKSLFYQYEKEKKSHASNNPTDGEFKRPIDKMNPTQKSSFVMNMNQIPMNAFGNAETQNQNMMNQSFQSEASSVVFHRNFETGYQGVLNQYNLFETQDMRAEQLTEARALMADYQNMRTLPQNWFTPELQGEYQRLRDILTPSFRMNMRQNLINRLLPEHEKLLLKAQAKLARRTTQFCGPEVLNPLRNQVEDIKKTLQQIQNALQESQLLEAPRIEFDPFLDSRQYQGNDRIIKPRNNFNRIPFQQPNKLKSPLWMNQSVYLHPSQEEKQQTSPSNQPQASHRSSAVTNNQSMLDIDICNAQIEKNEKNEKVEASQRSGSRSSYTHIEKEDSRYISHAVELEVQQQELLVEQKEQKEQFVQQEQNKQFEAWEDKQILTGKRKQIKNFISQTPDKYLKVGRQAYLDELEDSMNVFEPGSKNDSQRYEYPDNDDSSMQLDQTLNPSVNVSVIQNKEPSPISQESTVQALNKMNNILKPIVNETKLIQEPKSKLQTLLYLQLQQQQKQQQQQPVIEVIDNNTELQPLPEQEIQQEEVKLDENIESVNEDEVQKYSPQKPKVDGDSSLEKDLSLDQVPSWLNESWVQRQTVEELRWEDNPLMVVIVSDKLIRWLGCPVEELKSLEKVKDILISQAWQRFSIRSIELIIETFPEFSWYNEPFMEIADQWIHQAWSSINSQWCVQARRMIHNSLAEETFAPVVFTGKVVSVLRQMNEMPSLAQWKADTLKDLRNENTVAFDLICKKFQKVKRGREQLEAQEKLLESKFNQIHLEDQDQDEESQSTELRIPTIPDIIEGLAIDGLADTDPIQKYERRLSHIFNQAQAQAPKKIENYLQAKAQTYLSQNLSLHSNPPVSENENKIQYESSSSTVSQEDKEQSQEDGEQSHEDEEGEEEQEENQYSSQKLKRPQNLEEIQEHVAKLELLKNRTPSEEKLLRVLKAVTNMPARDKVIAFMAEKESKPIKVKKMQQSQTLRYHEPMLTETEASKRLNSERENQNGQTFQEQYEQRAAQASAKEHNERRSESNDVNLFSSTIKEGGNIDPKLDNKDKSIVEQQSELIRNCLNMKQGITSEIVAQFREDVWTEAFCEEIEAIALSLGVSQKIIASTQLNLQLMLKLYKDQTPPLAPEGEAQANLQALVDGVLEKCSPANSNANADGNDNANENEQAGLSSSQASDKSHGQNKKHQ